MNDTRLIREIKDRLTIIAFAVSIASAAIVILAVMAAVWFWRVEDVRQQGIRNQELADAAAERIERTLPLTAPARRRQSE
jgi:Flp pilus assembly protein TadB